MSILHTACNTLWGNIVLQSILIIFVAVFTRSRRDRRAQVFLFQSQLQKVMSPCPSSWQIIGARPRWSERRLGPCNCRIPPPYLHAPQKMKSGIWRGTWRHATFDNAITPLQQLLQTKVRIKQQKKKRIKERAKPTNAKPTRQHRKHIHESLGLIGMVIAACS